jgi:predicted lipoprotein with Yx(FWY)xxD motif
VRTRESILHQARANLRGSQYISAEVGISPQSPRAGMRKVPHMRLLSALAIIMCVACEGQSRAADMSLDKLPYPSALALSESNGGKWIYKSFPSLLPLYIFDGEPTGKSTCDKVCTAVWPIIQAEGNDRPMGLWTIVKRDDGRLQWAFKNKPVYTYFEDSTNDPRGVGKDMDWYLDDGGVAYLRSVGVSLPTPPIQTERKRGEEMKMLSVLLPPLN